MMAQIWATNARSSGQENPDSERREDAQTPSKGEADDGHAVRSEVDLVTPPPLMWLHNTLGLDLQNLPQAFPIMQASV